MDAGVAGVKLKEDWGLLCCHPGAGGHHRLAVIRRWWSMLAGRTLGLRVSRCSLQAGSRGGLLATFLERNLLGKKVMGKIGSSEQSDWYFTISFAILQYLQ